MAFVQKRLNSSYILPAQRSDWSITGLLAVADQLTERIFLPRCMSPEVCRFSDAGVDEGVARCWDRRPKSVGRRVASGTKNALFTVISRANRLRLARSTSAAYEPLSVRTGNYQEFRARGTTKIPTRTSIKRSSAATVASCTQSKLSSKKRMRLTGELDILEPFSRRSEKILQANQWPRIGFASFDAPTRFLGEPSLSMAGSPSRSLQLI